MKRFLFFCGLINCLLCGVAQSDSVYCLPGVDISTIQPRNAMSTTVPLQVIEKKDIDKLPAIQISDVLKLFSGIVIKDYGGVGGMKTVAARGFGSQHTAIAYDGILVTDCQTGQIDLSKFSLSNVAQMTLNSGTDDNIFLPARLFASASLIRIQTLRPKFTAHKPINLDVRFTGGSFGLWNPSFLMENRIAKKKNTDQTLVSSSLNINYLQSDGHYPFTIFYGNDQDSTSQEKRTNSDVKTLAIEENLFVDFNEHSQLNFKFYYYQSERGLPGAIIFYNTSSKQRLYDQNAFGQIHYENIFNTHWAYQINGKFNFGRQRYYDPDYLNSDGFIDNCYLQREYYLSNTVRYVPHRVIALSLSNDLIYGNMSANLRDFVVPSRLQSLTVLSAFIDTRFVDVRLGILHTGILNWVKLGTAAENVSRFSPSAGITVKPLLSEEFHIRLFYKNIFRLPSFNDLYYREVGSIHLKPEDTHQLDVGVTYSKSALQRRINFSVVVDGYYNRVKDKIVAIPSKNLFVWTMLNFGEVEIAGVDANVTFNYQIINDLKIGMGLNYSLQQAIDITDSKSKIYLHQIPYTPLHSGSLMFSVQTSWIDVCYTLLASGKRYALLQNVPANELKPYFDHSLSLSKDFNIKQKIVLGGKIELLNLADKHYEIIRNYPMQGRSFRLSIHLKW